MTTSRMTSGEELKRLNGLAGFRGLGIALPYPNPLTLQSGAVSLTVPGFVSEASLSEVPLAAQIPQNCAVLQTIFSNVGKI